MSKHRVVVLKVVSKQLSVTAAAVEYGFSRGHLQRLLRRYREGGLDALEARSRRPLTNPRRTADQVRQRIVGLRTELTGRGLDAFRAEYNERRPHRAIGRVTPAEAYGATPKAQAAGRGGAGHFRLRYDQADRNGAITLRRGGRLHHLKIGAAHARRRVLAIADEHDVTVVAIDTGEVLSTHRIEPDKGYWRNTQRDPGRWPRSRATG